MHQRLYERSGGRLGHRLIRLRFLLLRTTGRRTGQPRTVTLAYARDAGPGRAGPGRAGPDRADEDRADYLLVASNYGSARPPGWLLNIGADPRVQIQDGPRRTGAAARIVSPGDPGYDAPVAAGERPQPWPLPRLPGQDQPADPGGGAHSRPGVLTPTGC